MARPREYDEALRLRLIESAAQLLRDEGPSALSVRRIAAACDTSTAAIYSLLGNKRELVRAVYLEGFTRLGDHLKAADTSGPPVERLLAQARAYFDNAVANPNLYEVMFGRPVPEFEPDEDDVTFALSTLQLLIDAVGDCVDAGDLHGDARTLAMELWATSHGVCTLTLTGMLGTDDEARGHADRLARAAIAGLAQLGEAPASPQWTPGQVTA